METLHSRPNLKVFLNNLSSKMSSSITMLLFFFNGYVFLREEGASLVAQMGKNLPTVQETRVRSLGWEDALEEEMATHSSTLAWRIPWTEEPGGLHEVTKSRTRLSD